MSSLLTTPLIISAGAIPGALSRYYITILLARSLGIRFPYGTVVVNLSGSLIMGFVSTWLLSLLRLLPVPPLLAPDLQLLLMTGFLGSYTTFSTYALDTANLARQRGRILALGYWAGSAVGGAIFLKIGIALAQWMR